MPILEKWKRNTEGINDLSRNQVLGLEPQRSPELKLLTIVLYSLSRLSCTISAE